MNKSVKLYIYNKESNKTYIDIYEADDFEDFILVTVSASHSMEELYSIQNALSALSDKKVIILPDNIDMQFYGVSIERETSDNGSSDSKLFDATPIGETA